MSLRAHEKFLRKFSSVKSVATRQSSRFNRLKTMMEKIVQLSELDQALQQVRKDFSKIVLAGGCFDILHIGHIKFLREAKSLGDTLIILLESDLKVKELKGENRPLFNQEERAEVLSALHFADLVVMLPFMNSDASYIDLITSIKPDIIALTENDPKTKQKILQAKKVNSKVKIIPYFKSFSSSKLAKLLGVD